MLYCPVMWLRFFLLFFASRTPPLRFSTKTGSAGSREGPHLSERTPHSLVPDRTHNPARQEIRQGYGEGRPRLPYARETSRRPTRASHDCGPEGKEARGGADARAKLGVAPRVPRHASMGLDRTTDRGPRPRQCDSIGLPNTTERSRGATDASRAPRRLRRSGSRKKLTSLERRLKPDIWQHKSPNQQSTISIAASDQKWTSRTRRRRTPMPA